MSKETIIYISNQDIRILSGKSDNKDMIRIDGFKTYPLEEGCMLNGVILNEVVLKDVLSEVKRDGYTKLKLVIDSGQVLLKHAVIPQMNKKQILQFVKDELSNIDSSKEDLVYDYAFLRESKEIEKANEILCCGVERKLIKSYIDLFNECGLQLSGIDFSMNAINKFTNELSEFEDKTYVISILDGNNMVSVLFEHNEYKFSYRSRVLSGIESKGYVSEIVNNISHIFQFSKSQESKAVIESAYFCNLESSVEDEIYESIKNMLGIESSKLPQSNAVVVEKNKEAFNLDKYVFLVGSLIRK